MERPSIFSLGLTLVWLVSLFVVQETLAEETGKDLVNRAYKKTKTAESVDDYTQIIELCRQAQANDLPDELDEYAKDLLSWIHNRRGEVYAEQASTALESGNKQRAEELDAHALADFEKAVQYDATRWKAVHNRGVSYALVGKYQEAIADFSLVGELKPDYANAWFNLGEIRHEKGQLDQAVEDYAKAIELKRDDVGAFMGRGRTYLRLRRYQEAFRDYNQAVTLDSQSADAYAGRADAYQHLGMWEQAASDFRRANRLDNSLARAYRGAAWLMATCPVARYRQPELALQAAERAVELAEDDECTYLDTLAAAYANLGRFEDAIKTLNNALEEAKEESVREQLRKRLELYRRGEPFRQESPAAEGAAERDSST